MSLKTPIKPTRLSHSFFINLWTGGEIQRISSMKGAGYLVCQHLLLSDLTGGSAHTRISICTLPWQNWADFALWWCSCTGFRHRYRQTSGTLQTGPRYAYGDHAVPLSRSVLPKMPEHCAGFCWMCSQEAGAGEPSRAGNNCCCSAHRYN